MPIKTIKSAPLSSGFMLTSMFGFLLSVIYIPQYSKKWAFAFGFVFFLMFIASFISMQKANPDAQLAPIPRKKK